MYHTSGLVWTWCKCLTGHLPLCAKREKIEPLWLSVFLPVTVELTVSLPKHRTMWCLWFAIEDLSFESWKCFTPPECNLHLSAAQAKKWHSWLSWYWRVTSGLKNVWIGYCQVFLSLSRVNWLAAVSSAAKTSVHTEFIPWTQLLLRLSRTHHCHHQPLQPCCCWQGPSWTS